ncbi:hypothetical protein GE09DRAFT_298992 [Coniochaeta sp. 2T2.1]|nr:hypothetical protein GE09DRAFT_298992 [Coniochaeta sp. 2T2.1]
MTLLLCCVRFVSGHHCLSSFLYHCQPLVFGPSNSPILAPSARRPNTEPLDGPRLGVSCRDGSTPRPWQEEVECLSMVWNIVKSVSDGQSLREKRRPWGSSTKLHAQTVEPLGGAKCPLFGLSWTNGLNRLGRQLDEDRLRAKLKLCQYVLRTCVVATLFVNHGETCHVLSTQVQYATEDVHKAQEGLLRPSKPPPQRGSGVGARMLGDLQWTSQTATASRPFHCPLCVGGY